MRENKKKILLWTFISIAIIILALLNISLYSYRHSNNTQTASGVIWNVDDGVQEPYDTDYISIPGFSSLDFEADSTVQSVDFYNPDSNNCYMNLQILIDNEIIWECEELLPGYGYEEIELTHTLEQGTYSATYNVRCFEVDTDKEVNGCEVNFDLYVN